MGGRMRVSDRSHHVVILSLAKCLCIPKLVGSFDYYERIRTDSTSGTGSPCPTGAATGSFLDQPSASGPVSGSLLFRPDSPTAEKGQGTCRTAQGRAGGR